MHYVAASDPMRHKISLRDGLLVRKKVEGFQMRAGGLAPERQRG